jgi:hypothetical protein
VIDFLSDIAGAVGAGVGLANTMENPRVRVEFSTRDAADRFNHHGLVELSRARGISFGEIPDHHVDQPFQVMGVTFVIASSVTPEPPYVRIDGTPLAIIERALMQAFEAGRGNRGYAVGKHAGLVLDAARKAEGRS